MKELRLAFLTALLTCTSLGSGTRTAFGPEYGELVCRKNSLYTSIFVYRQESVVTLRFGLRRSIAIQSQMDTENPRTHLLEYTQMAFCGLLYKPDPGTVLVIGQGGGVIPREIRHYYPDAIIDVVEIDPEIPLIAQQYFAFKPDEKMRVHVADGRIFIKKRLLKESNVKYDWIILDAFNGDYIPFHLMTREFLLEVKSVLAEDGVVTANVFSSNRLFDAEWKTFLAVFKHCEVFLGNNSSNAMLVSTGDEGRALSVEEAAFLAAQLQDEHAFAFSLPGVAAQLRFRKQPDPQARVLTDDRAPVNWLKTQERVEQ